MRLFRCLVFNVVTALLVIAAPATAMAEASSSTPAEYWATSSRIRSLTEQVLDNYRDRSSPSDTSYYDHGLWFSDDMGCWTCNLGPSVAASVLAGDSPSLLPIVKATIDRAIHDHQATNGSFTRGSAGGGGIDEAFFGSQLGTTMLVLGDRVDEETRERWRDTLTRAADYLISTEHTTWYVNGNINLAYTEVLYLAWRVSGEQRFKSAYEQSWSFLVDPPKPRWAGYGLIYNRIPTVADGSDGSAYLTEDGGEGPGYDPEYTQLQLDTAASLYVVSHDPRALRLMNLLINQLLPRVDSTFTLDATNGSRHSLFTAFMTPALAILVGHGRDDLAHLLPGQTGRIVHEYQSSMASTERNYYRGLGSWLGTVLLDTPGTDVAAELPVPVSATPPAAAESIPLLAPLPRNASAVEPGTRARRVSVSAPKFVNRRAIAAGRLVVVVRGVPAATRLKARLRTPTSQRRSRDIASTVRIAMRGSSTVRLHVRSRIGSARRLRLEVTARLASGHVRKFVRMIDVRA